MNIRISDRQCGEISEEFFKMSPETISQKISPPYALLDPTGNMTILAGMPHESSGSATDSTAKGSLPQIADRLMSLEPSAEQVGFLNPGDGTCDISLTMAGGEFCGNATLSAAAVYQSLHSGQGLPHESSASGSALPLDPVSESGSVSVSASAIFSQAAGHACADTAVLTSDGNNSDTVPSEEPVTVTVRVSGADDPIPVKILRISDDSYEGTVRMPEAVSVTEESLTLDGTEYCLPVVRFKGISHIISEQTMDRKTAEKAVVRWCNDLNTDALGIMQINVSDPERKTLLPLVYVRTAGTLYWESSCASGTAAAGVWLAFRSKKDVTAEFLEPAGCLKITAGPDRAPELTGRVRIVKNSFMTGSRHEHGFQENNIDTSVRGVCL